MAAPDFAKGHLRLLAALAGLSPPASVADRQAACQRALRACPASPQLQQAMEELEVLAGGKAAAPEDLSVALATTRTCADDATDPRRFMAAGDLGSAYAVGAYGLEKDVSLAERYLSRGADGGDAASARNLGMLMLELGRPEEGAEALRRAALDGDEQAAATLAELDGEAREALAKARFQLEALASKGDSRARAMLDELKRSEQDVAL